MDLILKFIPPTKAAPVYRANVHRTGKIGLAIDTAKAFGFTVDKSIQLAINEGDVTDKSIYGVLKPAGSENTYKIMKGGNYHNINAKSFFDTIGVNYEKDYIAYEVTSIEQGGQTIIKFTKTSKSTSAIQITGMEIK